MVSGVNWVLRTVAVRHFGTSACAYCSGGLECRRYGGRGGSRAGGRWRVLVFCKVLGYDVLHERKREREIDLSVSVCMNV